MGMADDLPKGKLLGKLRQIWSKLSDGENYFIPESIEEIKVLGPSPFFHKLGQYPLDRARQNVWPYVAQNNDVELHPLLNAQGQRRAFHRCFGTRD